MGSRVAGAAVLALLAASASAQAPAAAKKLKVYISVDMEGVAGTVTGDQLGPEGFEYARYREFMTREVASAAQAAKQAGATEILIADSHGNGENLMPELLPTDVRVIRSWPRPGNMMAGLDESFDAALLLGYHASTDNPHGVRAHTFRSALFTHVGIDGKAISEGSFSAALAGRHDVPVVMVSGDDVMIAELHAQIGDFEAAEVKKSLGFHSANTLTPQASYALIASKVKAALARRADFKPYKAFGGPFALEISFKHYTMAEVVAYLPGVERTDAHSIRLRVRDLNEALGFLTFLDSYDQDMKP
jgi:D-amino peptidase